MPASASTIRPRSETDTTPHGQTLDRVRRGRTVRRGALAVFAVVLALGATGQLGVKRGHAGASGGGWHLDVTYPRVTRAGHAVPLWIEVRRDGGFGDDPVVLRLTTDYFSLFDANTTLPTPSAETATANELIWEFDPPQGDVLRVVFDTRTGPNRQRGESGEVAILERDAPVVSVRMRTRVMP